MTDAATAHDAHDHHAHDGGHEPVTVRGYVTGFVASAILTAIPFWLVMGDVLSSTTGTAVAIMLFGAVQIVVHMVYFLHLSPKSEGGWNMLATIFTMVLVVIALAGSLWVMQHMNTNMMPNHEQHGPEHSDPLAPANPTVPANAD